LEELGAEVEINSELISEVIVIRENIKISANGRLGYCELKKDKHGSTKDARNY
jgi:hypothetical protein